MFDIHRCWLTYIINLADLTSSYIILHDQYINLPDLRSTYIILHLQLAWGNLTPVARPPGRKTQGGQTWVWRSQSVWWRWNKTKKVGISKQVALLGVLCDVWVAQGYCCDTDDDNANGDGENEDDDDNGDNDDDDDSANDDDDSANGDDEGHKHVRVPGTRRVKTSRRDAFAFASGKDCSLSLSVVFTQSMQKMLW